MSKYILPSMLIVAIAAMTSIANQNARQLSSPTTPIVVETIDELSLPVVKEATVESTTKAEVTNDLSSWKIPKPQSQERPPIDKEIDDIKTRLVKLESKYSNISSTGSGSSGGGSAASTGGGSTGNTAKITYRSIAVPYQTPTVQVPRSTSVVTYQCDGNVCRPVTSQTSRTAYRRLAK
jgi:hypothetical protein